MNSVPLLLFSESEKKALIDNVKKLKVLQVKELCKAVGLPVKGVKLELINRVIQHIEARVIMDQNVELLALQTLVLKLLYNSPLPDYTSLVSAIKSGAVNSATLASLLLQFEVAQGASLPPTAHQSATNNANGRHTNGRNNGRNPNNGSQNNVLLAQNGKYPTSNGNNSPFMTNLFPALAHLPNVTSIDNLHSQAHLNAMGRTIGTMAGIGLHPGLAPVSGNMAHMAPNGIPMNAVAGRPGELDSQYNGPMLLFKSTIFYLLRRLVGTAQVLRASKGRNIKTFRIKLLLSEIKLLRENPNMKLYIFSGTESTPDHTNTPIQFPPIEIYVDELLTKQHTKGIKGKPGSARPADLTPYFVLFDRSILVRVVYSDAPEKYIFYTYIVEEFPLDQLSQHIESKPHIPESATRLAIQKENESGEGDEDGDIVVATSSLTLRCPLTYARMKQPVRSINCDHIQCFDGPSFLSMQQKIPLWQCPICSAYIDQHSLAVSDYLKNIIDKTPDSVDSVLLNPDGLWRAVEGEALLDSEDDEEPQNNPSIKAPEETKKEEVIEIISLDTDSEEEINVEENGSGNGNDNEIENGNDKNSGNGNNNETNKSTNGPPKEVPSVNTSSVPSIVASVPIQESISVSSEIQPEPASDETAISTPSPPSSDSPLSNVSTSAYNEEVRLIEESESAQHEKDEDEIVNPRSRRRAVILDASETEISRASSVILNEEHVCAEKSSATASPLQQNHEYNDKLAISNEERPHATQPTNQNSTGYVHPPAVPVSMPVNPPSASASSSTLPEMSRQMNPSLYPPVGIPGPNFGHGPYSSIGEAQFMRTMRTLQHIPPDANPFVPPGFNNANPPIMNPAGSPPAPIINGEHGERLVRDFSSTVPLENQCHANMNRDHLSSLTYPPLGLFVNQPSNRFASPGYQQLVNDSLSKFGVYHQQEREKSTDAFLYPPGSVINGPNSVPIPHMQLGKAHSISVEPHVVINGHDPACNEEVMASALVTTPKKRNNSVTGAPQLMEPTQASPSFPGRARNFSQLLSQNPEMEFQKDRRLSNTENLPVRTNDEFPANAEILKDHNKQENHEEGNSVEENLVSPTDTSVSDNRTKDVVMSQSINEVPVSTEGPKDTATTQARNNVATLFLSPVGSGILSLFVTTPANRKRMSSGQHETPGTSNKKPNQSPSTNIHKVAATSSATNRVRKAKFDPSTINLEDIIDLD